MGNGWFGFEGLSAQRFIGRYVEHTDFPGLVVTTSANRRVTRIASQVACSACSMILTDSSLLVHFGGASHDRFRILDVYDWDTGEYRKTLKLPRWADRVDAFGNRFHLLFADPYPQVMVLERIDPEGARS